LNNKNGQTYLKNSTAIIIKVQRVYFRLNYFLILLCGELN
jgi:hypothetical protein